MPTPRPREPDFDESADMRLVDLQRAALGVSTPQRGAWESQAHAEGTSVDPEGTQVLESAVLAIETTATPATDVIPGAIVTIALCIANEGVLPARTIRIAAPLPGGATYRNGSFVRDGRPLLDDAAEEFFGNGTLIDAIAPKSRVTFVWKIGVRLGNKPLVIAPSVSAQDAAIVGAQPVMVSRREGAQSGGFAAEVVRVAPRAEELPIYELDDEEIIEHEAAVSALSPILRQAQDDKRQAQDDKRQAQDDKRQAQDDKREAQDDRVQAQDDRVPTRPEPIAPPAPAPEPTIAPLPEQPSRMEPAAQSAPVREAVLLYGRLDRPSIAYFERIFNGSKAPTLLNHFILGGALACTRSLDGGDVAGLKAHMDAQGQMLQRIVLHEKIGKKEPIGEYAGKMLARVDQFVETPVEAVAPGHDPSILVLHAELEAPTLGVLRKMQDESARWDFTKARQLTLALQARYITASASPDRITAAQAVLRSYAQTAATQLQRFFVRMRIDRTTGLLFARDETLDAAARSLIVALKELF